jgi:dTDP-4-dehydrorhamnose reductase
MFHNNKVLIFGITGMLGQALKLVFQGHGETVIGSALKNSDYDIDITNDNLLYQILNDIRPSIIINTVAITDCNICDKDVASAYQVNARPSALMTEWAKQNDSYYIYISTDHYFSGDGNKQHNETTPVVLLNEYARSKFLGEVLTLLNSHSLVVRTNIVGFRGWSTPTFVEWIISTLKSKNPITLFDDYYTSSISVDLFSQHLLDLIPLRPTGIINLASRNVFSKKEFVYALAQKMELTLDNVKIGSVSNLQTCRAESLGLDVSLAESLLGHLLPTLQEVVDHIHIDYRRFQK